MGLSLAFVLIGVWLAAGQATAPAAPLQPLDFLVGRWAGTSEGEPGRGTVEREYTRVLGGRFIQVRNRAVYAPQEKNPKGETHEDLGLFSFDRSAGALRFRQFHSEGFVNEYRREPSAAVDTLVFVSESIENIPAGYRARETYRRLDAAGDTVEETFEIAEPGQPFAVYSKSRLTRVK